MALRSTRLLSGVETYSKYTPGGTGILTGPGRLVNLKSWTGKQGHGGPEGSKIYLDIVQGCDIIMECYTRQLNLMKPARDNSGASPSCIATLAGFFSGNVKMDTKKCNSCKQVKVVGNFYWRKRRHQYRATCKQCINKLVRKRYYANQKREVERKRDYHVANRDAIAIRRHVYNITHRLQRTKSRKVHEKAYPERVKAVTAVKDAKKTGALVVGTCTDCGSSKKEKKIQGHHDDYAKPLDVIWLCQSCHLRRHSKMDF